MAPLRRIKMKGILHYPIKVIRTYSFEPDSSCLFQYIYQCTYTDLVIIAKYEGKKKKDKLKHVEVKWN